MKSLIGIIFISSAVISAQTNQFYITDDRPTYFDPFVPTVDQIERAKHSKESRPAGNDPECNWGKVSDGFQLSIRLEKQLFTNDEPITASILLRNITDKPLKYYFSTPKDRELQIIVNKNKQKLYRKDEWRPGITFKEGLKYIAAGNQWSATVGPGTQRKFVVNLTDIFDLTTNGEYKVHARQETMTIAAMSLTNAAEVKDAIARKTTIVTNVVSGTATFYVTNSAIK